jgi:nitrous oxide reductase accessory protein NosL
MERTSATMLMMISIAVFAPTAGCGGRASGPPAIELDRSACHTCGMLISEPRFAAGYRVGSRTAVFDDIGCLLRALDREGLMAATNGGARGVPAAEVWLLDENGSWLTAADAVFVRSPELATPMGGGIQAASDRSDAERLAARVGGTVVDSFAELRELMASAAGLPAVGSDS